MAARPALALILGYGLLTGVYSLVLKRVLLLDVFVIASGFVLRVLAGSAAAAVKPSHWLLPCTFFLVKNLLDNGYCESCVDTVLKYAANNLWKD